jgi:PAS domain S-box-containing protein
VSQTGSSLETSLPQLRFCLPLDPARLARARERIRDYLRLYCTEHDLVDDVVLCVEEACTNAIRHSGSETAMEVSLGFEGGDLVAEVRDHGRGFDVDTFDPRVLPDLLSPGGRGLFLISRLMDKMDLHRDGGLEVRMVKHVAALCSSPFLESGLGELGATPGTAHRETRLRAFLEEIDEAFVALDWQYRYVFANALALRMIGRPREEVLGRTPWELVSGLADTSLADRYREAMELGRSSIAEHRSPAGDDWFEVRVYPTAAGISVYYREINERKHVEEELVSSQERLAAILGTISDAFYTLDRRWRLTFVNDRAADYFGHATDELLGRDFRELFPEAIGGVFEKSKRRAMESGEASSVEAYDEALGLWAEERDYPSPEGITVLLSDVTELKQAESERRQAFEELNTQGEELRTQAEELNTQGEELRTQTEELRTQAEELQTQALAVESANEGLDAGRSEYRLLFRTMSAGFAVHEIITDRAGRPVDYRFLEVNPAFEYLTGLRATEIVGRTAREVLPDLEDSWIETYGDVALNGRRASFESYAAPLERHYEVIAYSSSPGRFATIFSDITERKRIEEERRCRLEESQVMAEELEAQGAELQSRSEQLEAQAEELRAQTAKLTERADLAEALNTINRLVHSTLDFDEIMQRALDEGARALDVDYGTIELREEPVWVVRYQHGFAAEDIGLVLSDAEASNAARAAARGEPFAVADMSNAAAFDVGFVHAYRLRAVLTVPLVAHEIVTGCLLFYAATPRVFGDSEVDFARKLGATVSLALHNARLNEGEKEATRLSAALDQINALIHSTLHAEQIMQRVVAEASAAVGADSAVIALKHGDDWVAEYGYPEDTGIIHESVRLDEAPFILTAVAERRPIAIDDCETDSRCKPEVQRRFGVRSVLCLPLVVRDEALGVVLFNRHRVAGRIAPQTIDFAAKLAVSVSAALENARLYAAQQRIAFTLQENFVHSLPPVEGLELGEVSMPAFEPERIGGDFSDVFVVDDSRVAVLIGDVAGKGVRAAGLTETIRSVVRAFAAVDPSPAFVLTRTNRLLLDEAAADEFATAFFLLLDRESGQATYASAGHPAPVHLSRLSCGLLETTSGVPLGSFEQEYTDAHVVLSPDDYLVFYTDGVTEARGAGELFGFGRLAEAACALRERSAQSVAEGVRDAALGYAGRLMDDLQVVVVRLRGSTDNGRWPCARRASTI